MKLNTLLMIIAVISINAQHSDYIHRSEKDELFKSVIQVNSAFNIEKDGFYVIKNDEVSFNSKRFIRACYYNNSRIIVDNYWNLSEDSVLVIPYRSLYSGCDKILFFCNMSKPLDMVYEINCNPQKPQFNSTSVNLITELENGDVKIQLSTIIWDELFRDQNELLRSLTFSLKDGIKKLEMDVEKEMYSEYSFGW